MSEQDKIDRFLDKALSEYSKATPQMGFEDRLLANVRVGQNERHGFRWWWVGVPALAAMVLFTVLWNRPPKPAQVANAVPPRVAVPQAPKIVEPSRSRRVEVPRIKRSVPRRPAQSSPKHMDLQPRLATFPSGSASGDELARLAVSFVRVHPGEAQEIVQEQEKFRELAAAMAPLTQDDQK